MPRATPHWTTASATCSRRTWTASARPASCAERGAAEYAAQHEHHPELAIEQTLLLVYRYPVFFYVSRNSPQLAKRLHAGLEQMQADGSFDRFFFDYYRPVLEQAKLPGRRELWLDPPPLPPQLWLCAQHTGRRNSMSPHPACLMSYRRYRVSRHRRSVGQVLERARFEACHFIDCDLTEARWRHGLLRQCRFSSAATSACGNCRTPNWLASRFMTASCWVSTGLARPARC